MNNEELLLAIHNQCEATQTSIEANYDKPCVEVLREVLSLLSLLIIYVIKYR